VLLEEGSVATLRNSFRICRIRVWATKKNKQTLKLIAVETSK